MCGRFTLRTPMTVLVKQFALFQDDDLQPAYNIAPTQNVAVIRGAEEGGQRHLDRLRWGLIPFWAKDKSIGARMINARGETVAEKPAFRQAFKKRRCLVIADGYYEWKKTAAGKMPFHIHLLEHKPFVFAGLWERWDKGDSPIESCTIITTSSNELTSDVHDRMPVILPPDEQKVWLDESTECEELVELIQTYPSDQMEMDAVSQFVNNVRNQGPECLTPAESN